MKWWLALLFLCTACGPSKDACADVECEHGLCVVATSSPLCLCDHGFVASGLRCIAVADGGVPDDAGTTALPCQPNLCVAPHQSQCRAVGTQAVCSCDPGFAPSGAGCAETPVWECTSQHAGDQAEPDECPPLAPNAPLDGSGLERTIQPATDQDWFRFEGVVGTIIEASASTQTMPLLLEVFDSLGTTLITSDARGVPNPTVHFRIDGAPVFVRVRPLRSNDTGAYQFTSRVLDIDDFENTSASASHLTPGPTPVMGSIQYAGDLDVMWMTLAPAQAWLFTVAESPLTENTRVELQRIDGGSVSISDLGTGITVERREEVLLVAHGRTGDSVGGFSIGLESLGPDDYSDTPQVGPLITFTQSVQGRIERAADVDGFRLHVQQGHIVSVHGAVTSSTGSISVAVSDDTRIIQSPVFGPQSFVAAADQEVFVTVNSAFAFIAPIEWTLSADDFGIDDVTDEPPGVFVAPGEVKAGRIQGGNDIDVFRIAANTGHVMRVQLTAPAGASMSVSIIAPDGSSATSGPAPLQFLTRVGGPHDVFVTGTSATNNIPYTLSVIDLGTDDFPSDPDFAGAIVPGTPRAGEIQYPSDIDTFSFTAAANHVYDLANGSGSSTLRFTVQHAADTLTSVDGAPVSFYGGATGGLFTVQVIAPTGVVQPYSLTLTDRGPEDHGSTTATATPITLDAPVAGRIGYSGDVDAFTIALPAQRVFTLTMSIPNVGLRVTGPSGDELARTDSGQTLRFRTGLSGLHTVSVVGPGYGSSSLPPYTMTLTDSGVDDHGDTNLTATPITLGTAQAGAIQFSGDVDVFSLAVVSGHFYEARCTASCALQVQTQTSAIIAESYGTNLPLTFKASSSPIFVHLLGVASGDTYALTVSDLGSDDHGDTPQSATVLPFATTLAGTLEIPTDVDAFNVTVSARKIVKLTCIAAVGFTCFVVVRDSTNALIVSSNYSQTLGAMAMQDDTWTVTVKGNSFASTGFGYQLRIEQIDDDHGDTNATASPLTIGTARSGVINYGQDVDVFSFTTTSTRQLEIALTASSPFLLEIYDGAGNLEAQLNEFDRWTPPSNGTWYLWVSSSFGGMTLAPYSIVVR